MKNKILKTPQEYEAACNRIYYLINKAEYAIESDSQQGEEIEILSLLVEKYEQEHHHMEAPDPVEAIKFRMEQMDLKQNDIAPLFGGKTRVSEVLNKKRTLKLWMITLLNRYLGIPFESLIAGNKNVCLDPGERDRLLNNPSIKEYVSHRETPIF